MFAEGIPGEGGNVAGVYRHVQPTQQLRAIAPTHMHPSGQEPKNKKEPRRVETSLRSTCANSANSSGKHSGLESERESLGTAPFSLALVVVLGLSPSR